MTYTIERVDANRGGGAYAVWQDWPAASSLEFVATGQRDCLAPSGPGLCSLRNGTVFAALVGVGLTGGVGLALLVGSGGSSGYLIDYARREIPTTSEATWGTLFTDLGKTSPSAKAVTDTPAAVFQAADLVAEIKSVLGINVTDLAGIAGVSRQTIYDWVGEGQISDPNYERLLALRQVCLDWQARVKGPVGRLLRAKGAHGRSLLDLLGQESLDHAAIEQQLGVLAAKAVEQAEQRQARNAGFAPLTEKDQYENLLTHAIPAADS